MRICIKLSNFSFLLFITALHQKPYLSHNRSFKKVFRFATVRFLTA